MTSVSLNNKTSKQSLTYNRFHHHIACWGRNEKNGLDQRKAHFSSLISKLNLYNAYHESIIQVDVLPQRIDPPGIPKHIFSLLWQLSSSLPSGQSISNEKTIGNMWDYSNYQNLTNLKKIVSYRHHIDTFYQCTVHLRTWNVHLNYNCRSLHHHHHRNALYLQFLIEWKRKKCIVEAQSLSNAKFKAMEKCSYRHKCDSLGYIVDYCTWNNCWGIIEHCSNPDFRRNYQHNDWFGRTSNRMECTLSIYIGIDRVDIVWLALEYIVFHHRPICRSCIRIWFYRWPQSKHLHNHHSVPYMDLLYNRLSYFVPPQFPSNGQYLFVTM